MSYSVPLVRVFLGSSSEGREVARNLQSEISGCEIVRWDQNVFEPSGYTLDSLLATAAHVVVPVSAGTLVCP